MLLYSEKLPAASEAAIDLLRSLLIFDPTKRLTAAEALHHSYFINMYRLLYSIIDMFSYFINMYRPLLKLIDNHYI